MDAQIFSGDYEALKRLAKEFHDSIKTVDSLEQLDAGWKCFGLSYLEFEPANEVERVSAVALMRIMGREYMDAKFALLERDSTAALEVA